MMGDDYTEWFDLRTEYPSGPQRFDPPPAYWYQYVTSNYAQAVANCMTRIREVWLLRRYTKVEETEDGWERVRTSREGTMKTCSYFEDLKEEFHDGYNPDALRAGMDLRSFSDDIILLGEVDGGDRDYWVEVWFDQDVSDCEVARMPKNFNRAHRMYDWRQGEVPWKGFRDIFSDIRYPNHTIELTQEKSGYIAF